MHGSTAFVEGNWLRCSQVPTDITQILPDAHVGRKATARRLIGLDT
jgi:hypothetical protein